MKFLPEHHTDFIFSVLGEEFGFIGCMLLLLLFVAFFLRLIHNLGELKGARKKSCHGRYFGLSYVSDLINIGMNIGLVPATGIPLPFISYGGSNLLVNSIAVGVVLKYFKRKGFIVYENIQLCYYFVNFYRLLFYSYYFKFHRTGCER